MTFFTILVAERRLPDLRHSTVRTTLSALLLAYAVTGLPISAEAQGVRVALAQFTTAIEKREPIDQITFVDSGVQKIFFFTDLRNMEGQTVHHRWLHNGTVMADVTFEVRGPRWRVWSSKTLSPDGLGDWTVEVVTSEDEVIAAETFTYTAPPDV